MNQPLNPAPAEKKGGCCGLGCLSLFVLVLFFSCAFVGGGVWALYHFRQMYSSTEPAVMPEVLATSEAPVAVEEEKPVEATVPQPTETRSTRQGATSWKAFQKAARHQEAARIELSAGGINALIQESKDARGKAYVSVQNNIGHVRMSIPLKGIALMNDRYLNAEATIEASSDGDPAKARISNIRLGNESVSDGIIDQHFFGMLSARDVIKEWLEKQGIASFRIENNRAIGETRGAR